MAVVIAPDDLRAFGLTVEAGRAELLIEGALATARLVAPCLAGVEPDSDEALAAKVVIIGAIARWASNGNPGGVSQQSAGPFSTSYAPFSGKLSAAEQAQLRNICNPNRGKAFALDTAPGSYRDGRDVWMERRHHHGTIPVTALEYQMPEEVWI